MLVVLLAIGFTAAFGLSPPRLPARHRQARRRHARPGRGPSQTQPHRAGRGDAAAPGRRPSALRVAARRVGRAPPDGARRRGASAVRAGAAAAARATPAPARPHATPATPAPRHRADHARAARRTAAGRQADRPGHARARLRLLRRFDSSG